MELTFARIGWFALRVAMGALVAAATPVVLYLDDIAAAGAENRERFARCLVDLAERISLVPAKALGMFGVRNATLVRIRRLLDAGYSGGAHISRPLVGGVLVLVATLTLAIQAFSPIVAFATPATPKVARSLVAEVARVNPACTAPARVKNAVQPDFPESAMGAGGPYSVTIRVVLDRNGNVINTRIFKSSGRADLDAATIAAAHKSTYAPRIVGCKPVAGAYVFRADFSKN